MRDAQLRDFLALAAAGGVRAAARETGRTQASISRNVTALERQYGTQLVERGVGGIRLTEAGKILLQHARLAAVELGKAKEEITGLFKGRVFVSIGMSRSAEALLLPAVYGRFRAAFPDHLLNLFYGDPEHCAAGLRDGRLDLAVSSTNHVLGNGFTRQRLFSTDLVVVSRVGHPLSGAASLDEFTSSEWIRGGGLGQESALSDLFLRAGLPSPQHPVMRESFSALIELLISTDLLAAVTRPSVEAFVQAGMLQVFAVRERLPAVVFNLYSKEGRVLGKSAQFAASELRKAARAYRR